MERQLAAILFADVSGYGRLMDTHETDTHLRLMALRAEVIEPTIAGNTGRIVKNTGDGFIACFASVNSALEAAIGIQREIAQSEADEPPDRRIALRLGLHSGDVTLEAGDAYGAGVNLAARLQELAEPGSIFISGTVHEQLGGNLKVPSVDLGYISLKNIANPVRVFSIGGPQSKTGSPARRVWPAPLQSRPSIAVLPFAEGVPMLSRGISAMGSSRTWSERWPRCPISSSSRAVRR
jgi:adenylate cyclase